MKFLRLNPLASALCLIMVLAIGYLIVSMTRKSPQMQELQTEELRTLEVHEEPPPVGVDQMPAAAVRLPRLEYEPSVSADTAGGPDVSPTAAPGVAFNYRYAFRLPAERIAQVQEQHAAACERLGVDRCRITGLRYRVASEQNVEAMLALSLAPDIARRFGRAGIEAIARADGKLVDAEISGVDADRSIREAGRRLIRLREELRRIELRLSQQLAPEERLRLDDHAQRLRDSIRAAESGREEHQDSLASTPLVFQYGAGELAPVAHRPTIATATQRSVDNFIQGMSILLIIGVTLLPWALLAALAWWLMRLARRRLGRWTPSVEPAELPA